MIANTKALKTIPHAPEQPVRILDLGAGVGRVALEFAKLPHYRDIQWECWEPNTNARIELRNRLERANIQHHILDDLDAQAKDLYVGA